jgi:starch phosphorylase
MEKGLTFDKAWAQTRRQIVFTTHTPVPAGNEVHGHALLQYMGAYNGLGYEEMRRIGGDPFGMTVAGLRLAKRANAVAKLHGKTARRMWRGVSGAAKIIPITNGVHNGSWQDKRIIKAMTGRGDLWQAHMQAKQELIAEVERLSGAKLQAETLLIGFGRRAAGYKRADLIFRDKKVISSLLRAGKLQIVFSGKAHPNDLQGKAIVENLFKLSQRFPKHVVFLPNYNILIGRLLTSGCDVWLNNPVRPMEASGTSGMKAAMNGVLNLSVLDGWWPEGCRHGVTGWQIGDGYEGPEADKHDAASLYRVLRREVIPTYYRHREKWIKMMQASIKMSQEKFSAARMVKEYYTRIYRGK